MNVKGAARPFHTRDQVTDVQDTLQCDMSPIAKEWQANPPAVPLDPSSLKRFARPALSEETMALGGAPSASSVGAGSETPKDVDEVKQVIPDEVAVVGGSSDQLSKEPLVACDKGEIQTGDDGDEDLFHATAEPVTRKQQFAERDALKKEMKKTEGPHPEEGVPDKKTAKKNAQASKKAQAKAKAKAEAKKAAEKAKKDAEKAKKKAKKEAEKAKKEAEKAKKKAKKAEGKTRATKNGQKKRKQLEESQPSAENHENVSAVPENPPAPSPVPAEDVVILAALLPAMLQMMGSMMPRRMRGRHLPDDFGPREAIRLPALILSRTPSRSTWLADSTRNLPWRPSVVSFPLFISLLLLTTAPFHHITCLTGTCPTPF